MQTASTQRAWDDEGPVVGQIRGSDGPEVPSAGGWEGVPLVTQARSTLRSLEGLVLVRLFGVTFGLGACPRRPGQGA